MRTSHLAPGLLLALAACTRGFAEPASQVYRGIYVQSFETSSFTVCGASEHWWLSFASERAARDFSERAGGTGSAAWGKQLYVEWEGTPSERGQYGHLGSYAREFEVSRVLEARPATGAECR